METWYDHGPDRRGGEDTPPGTSPPTKGSAHVRVRIFIIVLLLAPWGAESVSGQEAEVREAINATLAAWRSGDFQQFATFYHADTRGFFLDGGMLVEGFNVATLEAAYNAGFRANLEVSDVNVRVRGDVALSTGLLAGALTMPGGGTVDGTWRYSDARVLDNGTWKVIQYHFSEMAGPVGR